MKTINLHFGIAMFAGFIAGAGIAAEPFPSKTMRVITVLPAGTDGYVRAVAGKLGEQMGQPVVVENRIGAGGVIAAQAVSSSAADGHTLLVMAAAFLVSKNMNPGLAYDPVADFAAVAKIYGGSSSMLLVRPDSPAKNVEGLLALAKANPGKFTYGVGGIGGQPHLTAASLLAITGTPALHIPFKTQSDVALAVLRGDVDFTILATTTSLPLVQTGKFRVLAVTSGSRVKAFPEIPTLREVFKNDLLVQETWAGLAAPTGIPADIVRRLHTDIVKSLGDPGVRKALEAGGNEPTLDESSEQFAAFIRRENEKWRSIVKLSGIKLE